MTEAVPTLDDIRAAAQRIAGRVRRTPVLAAGPLKAPPTAGELFLKLENLQVTGSFKARGATNKLLSLAPEQVSRGVITASGGNHGLAVAYAAHQAKTQAIIYLPSTTPAAKIDKLRNWGAEVRVEGSVWDEANLAAIQVAKRDEMAYFHPFADPAVIAGQGTVGLEILEDVRDLDMLVVAIGGGGLIAGIALAAKAIKPSIQVVGVEPVGAPTLLQSLAARSLVTLEKVETQAVSLAPRCSAELNLEIIRRNVDDVVLVSDEEMRAAAQWLWFELGLAVELSAAASIAALMTGRVQTKAGQKVAPLICGTGSDGLV